MKKKAWKRELTERGKKTKRNRNEEQNTTPAKSSIILREHDARNNEK